MRAAGCIRRDAGIWHSSAIFKVGATVPAVQTPYERPRRPSCASVQQALILRRAYHFGLTRTPHQSVWCSFFMRAAGCIRRDAGIWHSSAIFKVGATVPAVQTPYERPRCPSCASVQQALIASEARKSATKSRKPVGLRFFYALADEQKKCGRMGNAHSRGVAVERKGFAQMSSHPGKR